MTKEKFFIAWDKMYEEASKEFAKLGNPCQIDDKGTCIMYRKRVIPEPTCCYPYSNSVCRHLTKTGCNTKNYLCKAYICPELRMMFEKERAKNKSLNKTLSNLWDFQFRLDAPKGGIGNPYYVSKEEAWHHDVDFYRFVEVPSNDSRGARRAESRAATKARGAGREQNKSEGVHD